MTLQEAVLNCASDRFEKLVYYAEELKLFTTIDLNAEPTARDWVVVRDDVGLAIESFRGQRFIGVAKILNFYSLVHSEQESPLTLLVPD